MPEETVVDDKLQGLQDLIRRAQAGDPEAIRILQEAHDRTAKKAPQFSQEQQEGAGDGGDRPGLSALLPTLQGQQQRTSPNLRLFEAASRIGEGLLAERAANKTAKKQASSQALANVTSALGRPTAPAPVVPERNRLGTLLGGLRGLSEAVRTNRAEENQVSTEGLRNALSLGRLQNEQERLRQGTVRLGQGDQRLSLAQQNFQLRERLANKKAPQTVRADNGDIHRWDPDKQEFTLLFVGEDDAPNKVTNAFLDYVEEVGRGVGSFEEFMASDPGFAEVFQSKSEEARRSIQGAFDRGSRLHDEDIEKKMAEANKAGGSASERLQIADAKSFQAEMAQLAPLWEEAGWKGAAYGIMKALGFSFDPEESPATAFIFRRFAEPSAQLSDALSGFGLKIARVLNGGRPSDRDLLAARRLLPLQSDTDDLARRKIEFLQRIFDERVRAIEAGLEPPPTFTETAEEFVRRTAGSGAEGGEAATVNAQEGVGVETEGDF